MHRTRDPDEPRLRKALEGVHDGPTPTERWRTSLTMAFYAGDIEFALTIVRAAGDAIAAVAVLDDVLAPAMHDIGALWERNEITVADEHLATAMGQRLLTAIAPALIVAPASSRETILLATPASERHTMGLLMANDVLYGAGYDTVLLGAGVPDVALGAALERHRPSVVGLSATMSATGDFAAAAKMVYETLPDAHLMTGGRSGSALTAGFPTHYVDRLDGLLGAVEAMLR